MVADKEVGKGSGADVGGYTPSNKENSLRNE